MEFTRLADVEVVETATDVDKVLIEQNGEIKRVPKTEVGGSVNMLVLDGVVVVDTDTGDESFTITSNMTLEETIEALNNRELTGAIGYFDTPYEMSFETLSFANVTEDFGFACLSLYGPYNGIGLYWTADGFSLEEPTPAET